MKKFLRSPLFYVVFALVILLMLSNLLRSGSNAEKLSLSALQDQAAQGNVKTATLTDPDSVKGELRAPIPGHSALKYESKYPAEYADELTTQLRSAPGDVHLETKPKKE